MAMQDDRRDCPPQVCPRYQRAAEIVGRRWSAAVIRVALDGPVRFTEIRGAVPGLSARLLVARPRELDREGIVDRVGDGPAGHPAPRHARSDRARATGARE